MVDSQNNANANEHEEPHIKQIWWQTSLVLLFTTVCIYIGMGIEGGFDRLFPEQRPFFSVFNNRQSGWSGLFEMARSANFDCQVWEAPYRELQTIEGLLIIVQPTQPLEDGEMKQILNWVKAGNQLVYIDLFSFGTSHQLMNSLGLAADDANIKPAVFQPEKTAKHLDHVDKFLLSAKSVINGGDAVVKARTGSGALLTEVKLGAGRVLLGTMPTFCSNERLDDPKTWGAFQYLLNWFATSKKYVLFDERCHGFSGSQNVFGYLLHGPAGPPFAQGVFILLLGILSAAQRWGEILKVKRARKISNLEFVDGLAGTYQRSGAAGLAASIIVSDFRNRVAKWANVSPHATDDELANALSLGDERSVKLGEKIKAFFVDHSEMVKKGRVSEQELCREIESLDGLALEGANNFDERRG